jgi:DNA-binding beta-propeller fold protein YncE
MRLFSIGSGQLGIKVATLALGGTLGLTGCKETNMAPPAPAQGSQLPTSATSVASLTRPIAAALSPDAKTVYVTAFDANGQGQIYSGPVSGGTVTLVSSSVPLSYPCSIAITSDGNTLVVADLGDAGQNGSSGAIYAGTTSGNLTALSTPTSTPQYPTGVALSLDDQNIYVTGTDPTTNPPMPGVWMIPVKGGTATQLFEGSPLSYPAGVAVANDGNIYVADTSGMGTNQGAIFRIQGNRALQITKTPLHMNFPVGLASAGTGFPDLLFTATLVLGTPTEPYLYQLSPDGTQTPIALTGGVVVTEATSLRRAPTSDSWVMVDGVVPAGDLANMPGTPDPAQLANPNGQVIQLSP